MLMRPGLIEPDDKGLWTDEQINLICKCGHRFGQHMGRKPHSCAFGGLYGGTSAAEKYHERCYCTMFHYYECWLPAAPTAEQLYEALTLGSHI